MFIGTIYLLFFIKIVQVSKFKKNSESICKLPISMVSASLLSLVNDTVVLLKWTTMNY